MSGDEYARRMASFYTETVHPWGIEPDEFVVAHVDDLMPGTVLDLGAGDGRDALFLARRGFRVVAVDLVDAALAQLRGAASAEGLAIETHVADIGSFPLAATYENVVSTFTLHFLPWQVATDVVARAKERTAPGGCHLLSIFTKDGGLYRPGSPGFWLEPGGLRALYDDWDVLHDGHRIVETVARDEAGKPFRQPTDELVARKPAARSA
jgi:tellurite methyltransferase